MVKTRANVASSASKNIEFFRVYVPEFSADQLVLPPAFIDILEEPLPHEANLHDQTGRSWLVTIEKERKLGVSIKNGWRDFASHHSLEFGDFLIFNYDANSNFSVSIFSRNGLKKYSGVTTNSFAIPVKEEPGTLPDKSIPDRRVSDCVVRKTKKSKRSCQVKPCEMSWVPVMKCEEEELSRLREAGFVLPKNPYFERKLTASSAYRMDIQKSFLRSHGIQMEPNVEFYDQNGKKWPMKVYSVDKRTSFSTGWSEFRTSHNLGRNTTCLFEFVLGSGNKCKEVRVQISHVRSKINPNVSR